MKINKKIYNFLVAGLISVTAITGTIIKTQYEVNANTTESVTQLKETGTTKTWLNMRKSSSVKGAKITVIPKGKQVTILNKLSNGWYKVQYDGKIGFSYGTYITLSSQTTTIGTGETTYNLNFRTGSSTKYKILATIPKGTKINLLKKESNGWYKVQYNGKTGYVCGLYLKVGNQTTTPETTIATGKTTENLHLRTGSSTSYKSLTVMPKGAKVNILKKESNGWYKVQYNGRTGYSSGAYIVLDGQVTTPTPTPQENAIGTGKTTENLHLRIGSSTSYKSLTVMPKGAKVEILKKESNGWYKVRYNGTTGYASGAYIVLDSQATTPTPEETPEVKPEVKPEETPEVKPEETPEVKPEETPEVKPEPTPEPEEEVKAISFAELRSRLVGLGFDDKGNFMENGVYVAKARVIDTQASFLLEQNTPKVSTAVKTCFNLLLPTEGNRLWTIITNPCENQTLQMDGKTVVIQVFDDAVSVDIF